MAGRRSLMAEKAGMMKTDVALRQTSGHFLARRVRQALMGALCLTCFAAAAWAGNTDQTGTPAKSLAGSRKAVRNSTKAHPIGSGGQSASDSAADHNSAKGETNKPVSHGKISVDNTHKGHPVGASGSGDNQLGGNK
jgi:hypothetical protein